MVDQDRKEGGVNAIRTNMGRAALIVIAMLGGLSTLGGGSGGMWTGLKDKISAAG